MSKDRVNAFIVSAQFLIRDTTPTEDEYLQSYIRGVEGVLQLIAEAWRRETGA